MRRPKVLYLIWQYPETSQTYIHSEIACLQERYEIFTISLIPPSAARHSPVPFEHFELSDMDGITARAREFAPDVIHTHWMHMTGLARHVSRAVRTPYTIRSHSFDLLERPPDRMAADARLVREDACLGVLGFPWAVERLIEDGAPEDKLRATWPVVDYARFHDESPNGSDVMNVGACVPKKKMEDFLLLALRMPHRRFRLYASGYLNPHLRQRKEELGSPAQVVPATPHEDMPREYKRHEWLVYTADWAPRSVGWPIVVAEAQASGVGVCMPNLRPDLAEYVGDAGYLYESLDEALAIISQPFPEDRRRLGFEHARRSDIAEHVRVLEELWAPVLDGRAPGIAAPDTASAELALQAGRGL